MNDLDAIVRYCKRRKKNALKKNKEIMETSRGAGDDDAIIQQTMVDVYQDVISFIQYKKSGGLL